MSAAEKKNVLREYQQTGFELQLSGVSLADSGPMLPLIHSADAVRNPDRNEPTAADYFACGQIMLVPCDVFDENLVYTYVGRPAFRELRRPVCLILRPAPELLQNVFVFDTGAYCMDRYSKIVDSIADVNRFRIPADAEAIRRFIKCHFGDNRGYYWSQTNMQREYELMDSSEEFGYSVLVRLLRFSKLEFDTRCRTIENILRTPIPLEKYLQAVIVPMSLAEEETFRAFRQRPEANFEVLQYNDEQGSHPAEYCNTQLETVLFNYYVEKGYVSNAL